MDSLENTGISVIGIRSENRRPVIVIGPARGGTSMVAGALAKLGVFMGDLSRPPVYEDVRLSKAIEANDLAAARLIVADYDSRYPIWGWKRPSSIDYLPLVDDLFDRPIYIFVFKDIFSIAMRNSISMLRDIFLGMEDANRKFGQAISFLRQRNPRAMLVSYDKALLRPDLFVNALIDFCGLDVAEDCLREAIEFIRPNPADYLDSSRITKSQGNLGGLVGNSVRGWARYVDARKSAVVDIYLNDVLVGSTSADLPRADLEKLFGISCAFSLDLPEGLKVGPADVLRARVSGDVVDIGNSPLPVSKAQKFSALNPG